MRDTSGSSKITMNHLYAELCFFISLQIRKDIFLLSPLPAITINLDQITNANRHPSISDAKKILFL